MNKLFIDYFIEAGAKAADLKEPLVAITEKSQLGIQFQKRNEKALILCHISTCRGKFADPEVNALVEVYIADYAAWLEKADEYIDAYVESVSGNNIPG
ncbi:hypothetical protein CJD36_004520 [Flavipsychrobacter stenotrophus]|uniref:Uncharacterized protein n=1 Tax=Flavipsychrobacter stenotrophus TaxID=2077091 RepID=A0A2S7T1C4_9BACT|nr:hypothetical protein [Flavipsychrobacter stenotrophus]PQJ13013.1 hypothetical protein CJD36_004520 [Flavipsychrobacter stenotrophus]